jgi:uncharacterized membrane-anchored protein
MVRRDAAQAPRKRMTRLLPPDHPQRRLVTDELHARPFPPLTAPSQAIQLAFKPLDDRMRDVSAHRAHLARLIAHHGAPEAAPDADHYYAAVGPVRIKWERHTEYVSYTLFEDGPADAPFSLPVERLAPADWLAEAPGALISAIRLHIERVGYYEAAETAVRERFAPYFVAESFAAAHVAEGQATVFGDFRIAEDGFMRFGVLAGPKPGERRLGRIVQRLIEIENYRALSMLALPVARRVNQRLNAVETEMAELIAGIAAESAGDHDTLTRITRLSAALESLAAETAFRFAASNAYAALVEQRISVLQEERAADRQKLSEFMARRFNPAMRTVRATERRLAELTERASRTVRLLGARVNVAVETQNQQLLASMNRRAELQLQLQRTVEGLSVVAISYYAVGLAGYVVRPLVYPLGIDANLAMAVLAVPLIGAVWLFVRRLRHELEKGEG